MLCKLEKDGNCILFRRLLTNLANLDLNERTGKQNHDYMCLSCPKYHVSVQTRPLISLQPHKALYDYPSSAHTHTRVACTL